MRFINNNIKWIMLLSGIATCFMLYAAISPQAALLTNFGETLASPLSDMIVRSWGFLVFLMGSMLIYGAYNTALRKLVLTVVGASKLFFIALVFTYGYVDAAMSVVAFDFLMVLLYVVYLATNRGK